MSPESSFQASPGARSSNAAVTSTALPHWSGVWPALVTPFSDGHVDHEALVRLTREVSQAGVAGVVALGTTGEASALCERERDEVIETVLEAADGMPVVVGTGSNISQQTATRTRRAAELGAAGALVVTPYYVKPNPAGLLGH